MKSFIINTNKIEHKLIDGSPYREYSYVHYGIRFSKLYKCTYDLNRSQKMFIDYLKKELNKLY